MEEEHFKKLSMFCNVPRDCVIEELDVKNSIYEVPLELARQGLDLKVLELLRLEPGELDLDDYRVWLDGVLHPETEARVAVVENTSAIRTPTRAFMRRSATPESTTMRKSTSAGRSRGARTGDAAKILGKADAIPRPRRFGERGVPGKIKAVEYARTHKIPFLGICLGMQCAVIEFARDVVGWGDANSTEFDSATTHPVIDLMEEQRSVTAKAARCGSAPIRASSSRAAAARNSTTPPKSANATVTVTSSIRRSKR